MRIPTLALIGSIAFALSAPNSEARPRHGYFYGPAGTLAWRHGYWFHGNYLGHVGWWWIVGPSWYYYPSPYYPYPPGEVRPVYVVQVTGTAPPPAPSPATPPPTYAPPPATDPPPPSGVAATPAAAAPAPAAPALSQAFTYYCEKSKGYYPAVSSCAEGWIATPVPGPH